MKLRCPYCQGIFGTAAGATCPHCGKVVNLPSKLRARKPTLRVTRRDRTSRYDDSRREVLTPTFQFGRKPSTVLFSLAILAVVGGFLLIRASARLGKSQPRTPQIVALEAVDILATASRFFARECGRLPSNEEGLIVLISNPGVEGWDGPYITMIKPDPWEEPYRYLLSNGVATISSSGPDQQAGTADDIAVSTDE
ncbi:MAG: type II secretion system protein GspG [Lentisphaerae bacterium]|nr:type II secretion system protein GspG [Lentisphaerota bacterium]